MGIGDLTFQNLVITAMVILLFMESYNKYSTFKANRKKQQEAKTAPVANAQTNIKDAERRIAELEKQTTDLHNGMMVICAGVQALLEHELHNGNATEMENASGDIKRWLIGR